MIHIVPCTLSRDFMPSCTESHLPAVVSLQLVVYQNRQLIRIVRELRSRARQNPQGLSPDMQSLHAEIDALRSERTALFYRLDRVQSALETCRERESPPEKPVTSPPLVSMDDAETVPGNLEASQSDHIGLRDEIVRLKASMALFETQDNSNPALHERDEIMASLVKDRDTWMQRALKSEDALVKSISEVAEKFRTIHSSVETNEQVFIQSVEHMAQEIVRLQHDLRKTQLLSSDLEGKLQGSASRLDACNHGGERAERQPDSPAEQNDSELLRRTRGLLRMKEEQCSRLLAQHVQMQHHITTFEQDITLLRQECNRAHDTMQKIPRELSEIQTREESSLRSIESMRSELVTERALKSHTESDLAQALTELAQFREIQQKLNVAWVHMQRDNQELIAQVDFTKRARLETSLGRQTSANISPLVQLEMDELKMRIKCTLCSQRNKSVTLITCMHCFCRDCVNEKMLNARNRKCPLCMQRFADADVREVHFLQN